MILRYFRRCIRIVGAAAGAVGRCHSRARAAAPQAVAERPPRRWPTLRPPFGSRASARYFRRHYHHAEYEYARCAGRRRGYYVSVALPTTYVTAWHHAIARALFGHEQAIDCQH